MTVGELRQSAVTSLKQTSPSAELDANVLLQFVLGCDKTYILFHRDDIVDETKAQQFLEFVSLRKTGLPVAYITGHKEFFGIDFVVTRDVLIPKPDTEILVEEALNVLWEKSETGRILTVCDMCTGSGCVGLSILNQCKEQNIFADDKMPAFVLADISDKALNVASKNSMREEVISYELQNRIKFVRSNLFQMVTGSFDLITANPPYIPARETIELLQDGRSEPVLALNGDVNVFTGEASSTTDGLAVIRELVPQAYEHLVPGGTLLVEAGEYNAEETQIIFSKYGFKKTEIFTDLEGQLRVVKGTKL